MSNQPIGIFDSGVGGTSIWKAIHDLLPNEHTVYLADSKNSPYGNKTKAEIIALSKKNTELLLKHNCKLIVVACNTATTNAVKMLRATYKVPFIGIEPAIKPAAIQTKTKAIGVLATRGTLSSELFYKTSDLYRHKIKVIEQIGEGIVPLIEHGEIASHKMKALLSMYLKPMIEANIDYLVLGCTHYPYLIPQLLELLPKHVKIIDAAEAVAKQTKTVLEQHKLLNMNIANSKNEFYTNGSNSNVINDLLGKHFSASYLEF